MCRSTLCLVVEDVAGRNLSDDNCGIYRSRANIDKEHFTMPGAADIGGQHLRESD